MATGESGLTPAVAADRTPPTFNTVRRGLDPDQVIGYLNRVGERVHGLEARLAAMEKERDEARRERDIALEAWDSAKNRDPYTAMSGHVAELVRSFDEEVEKLRRDAQMEADRIVSQARSEVERTSLEARGAEAEARVQADEILRQAREEAERIRREAGQEAEQVRTDLASLHGSTLDELRLIRDHMVSSVRELEVVLNGNRVEDRVVVVGEPEEEAAEEEVPALRPDSQSELGH